MNKQNFLNILMISLFLVACGGGGGITNSANSAGTTPQQSTTTTIASPVLPAFWGVPVLLNSSEIPRLNPTLAESPVARLDDSSTLIFDSYGWDSPISLVRVSLTGEIIQKIKITERTSSTAVFLPTVHSDQKGGAFVVWVQSDFDGSIYRRRIYVRSYNRITGLGPIVQLSAGIINDAQPYYRLAVRPDGSAMIAWVNSKDSLLTSAIQQDAIFCAEYHPLSGWSEGSQVVEAQDREINQIYLTTSSNGSSMIGWVKLPFPFENYKILTSHKPQGGSWQKSTVAALDPREAYLSTGFADFDVVIGNSGNAMAVWRLGTTLTYNRFQATSGWIGQATATDTGNKPFLAMNGKGEGFLGWNDFEGSSIGRTHILIRKFDESGWKESFEQILQPDPLYEDNGLMNIFITESGRAAIIISSGNYRIDEEKYTIRTNVYVPNKGWSPSVIFNVPNEFQAYFSVISNAVSDNATLFYQTGSISGGITKTKILNFNLAAF